MKGAAAYFASDDSRVDEYALYVIQLERQTGELFFVDGYTGETVTLNLTLIRGQPTDFLGQYQRNSYALLLLLYSF